MEPLHAPWRLDYILMPKPAPSEVSLFTQIAQSSDDVANLVLARERTCFALMNAYPYTDGHLMTVPYKPGPDVAHAPLPERAHESDEARRLQSRRQPW